MKYTLRLSKKAKNISLKIDHRGLFVVTPKKLRKNEISKLITEHKDWIDRHKHKIVATASGRSIKIGEDFEFLGISYKVETSEQIAQPVKLDRSKRKMLVGKQSKNLSSDVTKVLRREARAYLIKRANTLASRHGFKYNKISVRDQATRWGSCSSKRNLNFNWRLCLAPLFVSDYVILHELAHTKHLNHSKDFWGLVESCMPRYTAAKKWLKLHGHSLHEI